MECPIQRGPLDRVERVGRIDLQEDDLAGGDPVARLHARDEYRCLTIRYQEGEDAPRTDHYLVDLYRGRTADLDPYMGPELLNSMLSAVACAPIAEASTVM